MTDPNQYQQPQPSQPAPAPGFPPQPQKKKGMNGCVLAAIIVGAVTLLGVIILASISVPVYNNIIGKARAAKALSNAKQIAVGCKIYAGDNGGIYPTAGSSSNESFALLVPDYIPTESIFVVDDSKWGSKCDDLEPYLGSGENHWAYMSGLNEASFNSLPFIFEGSAGEPGVYTDDTYKRGSRGGGEKAIVVWTDLSAKSAKLETNAKGELVLPIDFAQVPYPKEAKYQNPLR